MRTRARMATRTRTRALRQCDKCAYRTADTSHMRRHVNIVHELARTFACPPCNYVASTRHNLEKHKTTVKHFVCYIAR